MTDFNMKEFLGNLTSHVTFEYDGLLCGAETGTNKAAIIYSKTGAHIYPRLEEE